MFVAGLDRAWLHTPFRPPGFQITRVQQLKQLQQYCEYVFIDPGRNLQSESDRRAAGPAGRAESRELSLADRAMSRALREASAGGYVHTRLLTKAARCLVDAVLHDPDPLLWQARTQPRGGLLRRRAVEAALLATILGHQLGISQPRLTELALGGLLLDLGKTRVPVTILATPRRLGSGEMVFARNHVMEGCTILRYTEGIPVSSFTMVSNHHERMDGSGYPRGLRGRDIPLFARIAAIVDTYNALITDRGYAEAVLNRSR